MNTSADPKNQLYWSPLTGRNYSQCNDRCGASCMWRRRHGHGAETFKGGAFLSLDEICYRSSLGAPGDPSKPNSAGRATPAHRSPSLDTHKIGSRPHERCSAVLLCCASVVECELLYTVGVVFCPAGTIEEKKQGLNPPGCT